MTNRFEYFWQLDGLVGEQRCYLSESPIDTNAPPSPVAVLSGDVRSHVETGLTLGKHYYTRIGAIKNSVEKFSDEQRVLFGKEWMPSNLTNAPKIWLDAANSIKDSSNRVSQLTANLSNTNAIQSNSLYKPIYQNDKVKFDGVDDLMSVENAQNIFKNIGSGFIFTVASKNQIDASFRNRTIFSISNNSNGVRASIAFSGGDVSDRITLGARRLDSESFNFVQSTEAITANKDYIIFGEINYAARALNLYVNGILVASSTSAFTSSGSSSDTQSARVRLAANSADDGFIQHADIALTALCCSDVLLSNLDRQKLEGWAAHKYGLTENLPDEHPYKTLVPTI